MTGPDVSVEVTMPPGSVIITPAQMYTEIQTMGKKLDHLAAVIDPAFSTIREEISGIQANVVKEVGELQADISDKVAAGNVVHIDHESRIRLLEKRVWVAAGFAAAAGTGLSQLLPLLGS